jgi:hypothetical protein
MLLDIGILAVKEKLFVNKTVVGIRRENSRFHEVKQDVAVARIDLIATLDLS